MTEQTGGPEQLDVPETEEEKHVRTVVDNKLGQFAEEFTVSELGRADKDMEAMLDKLKGKKKK